MTGQEYNARVAAAKEQLELLASELVQLARVYGDLPLIHASSRANEAVDALEQL